MELNFYTLCVIYLVYSFLGWVGEVLFTAVVHRKYQDRGVLSGPLCLLYLSLIHISEPTRH